MEDPMFNVARKSAAMILIAASIVPLATATSAAPIAGALAIKDAAPAAVETVRGGWGWGLGAGLVAGAIVGGALAAPYYYGPGYYYPGPYYPGPYYPAPAYYPPGGNAVGYCMQRFRSYDPASGTYLGNDGYRHPCP
jgi:BA14K-like protein